MFLTLSIAESRTPRIDEYRQYTLDRATFEGHYYSEKAPGLSLAALPAVTAGLWLFGIDDSRQLLAAPPDMTPAFERLTSFATFWTSGLFAALAVLATYLVSLRLGASQGGAVFGAVGLAWATPLWGWATAFIGHAMAAGCLALALLFLLGSIGDSEGRAGRWPAAFAAGALMSWACVVEYTAAGAVLFLVLYAVLRARSAARRVPAKIPVLAALAALVFATPLFVYNASAFGSAWTFGYSHTESWFPAMKEGILGVTFPDLRIAAELLFGSYRGIFWVSILGLVGLGAALWLWRRSGRRVDAALFTAIPLYYILLNASYAYWDGGWSTGPRHLTAMLPFVMIPLSLSWTAASRPVRAVLVGVCVLSAVQSLICVSTSMFSPSTHRNALVDFLLPSFLARLSSEPPPVAGAFATVAAWEFGWPHLAGLLASASIPLAGCAGIALRLRSRTLRSGG